MAPVKYTPVAAKGTLSFSRSLGNGGGSGALYAFPVTLLQVIHFLMMLLTICLILGIQNF
jgi:hypothetical protein